MCHWETHNEASPKWCVLTQWRKSNWITTVSIYTAYAVSVHIPHGQMNGWKGIYKRTDMNIWARYSSRQQDMEHHSTLYHTQNELALHGETGTLIQCEGSCLLNRKQEQMNNWRHKSTGYRTTLLQVTATEWRAPTGAAIFTPCPLNQIKPNIYQVGKITQKSAYANTIFFLQYAVVIFF